MRCGFSGDEAYKPFVGMVPPPLPMRDAAFGLCTFGLTLLDCFRSVAAAMRHRLFAWDTFDVDAYEHDEQLCHGDINWIVPGKFVAFSGPLDDVKRLSDGKTTWHPRQYREYFQKNHVTAIVRLNKACYDRSTFTRSGIEHFDLFYPDGGLAPPAILAEFLRISETSRGAVGVHCKAGLGRTGTVIGAYLMKHFRFSGREAIGWLRICRPGSVLGPQQQYLEKLQPSMWASGEAESLPAHHGLEGSHTSTGMLPTPAAPVGDEAAKFHPTPHHNVVIVDPRSIGMEEIPGLDAGPSTGFLVALARTGLDDAAARAASLSETDTGTTSPAPLISARREGHDLVEPSSSPHEPPSPSQLSSPATPISSDPETPPAQVHTPGHGRAKLPWMIRADRSGSAAMMGSMGAHTPSAVAAAGVEVDTTVSPGGSVVLHAHMAKDHPSRGGFAPSGSGAAASSRSNNSSGSASRTRVWSETSEAEA
jgi:protein-tyrosine phosphatase